MITIRSAEPSDIEALLPLLEQLGYPTTKESLEKRFAKFLSNEGYGVAVACMNNKIVGFVAWSKSNLFVSDKVRIHIEGIAVDKNYRGQNIGKQLMQFVENSKQKFSQIIIDLTSGIRRANVVIEFSTSQTPPLLVVQKNTCIPLLRYVTSSLLG